MLKPIIAACLASVMLAGCASGPLPNTLILDPSLATSLNNIGSFTLADLANADAIALKAGDQQGHQCYVGLEVFVAAQQASVNGAATNTVSGAFSAFEAARTAAQGGQQLISQATLTALENACGPLVVDVQNTPAKFMAALAGLGAPK